MFLFYCEYTEWNIFYNISMVLKGVPVQKKMPSNAQWPRIGDLEFTCRIKRASVLHSVGSLRWKKSSALQGAYYNFEDTGKTLAYIYPYYFIPVILEASWFQYFFKIIIWKQHLYSASN